jgi:hypothetical protein
VLLDTTYVGVPAWDRMDNVIKSWICDTISPDLQDVTRHRGHTTHDAWLELENHFLGNRETRTLHIDAAFRSFVQGDLSVNDYYRKMKSFTDSLSDLDIDVTDHVLVYYDNVSAVYLSTNPVQHQCMKHVEIDLHFIRECVAIGDARIMHAPMTS